MRTLRPWVAVLVLSCLMGLSNSPIYAKKIDRASSPSESSSRTIIKMWVMPNSPRPIKDLQEILKEFEAKNPDIKVEVSSLDWGSAWTKINAAAISKEAPDITQLGTTWVGVFSAMDALEVLNSRLPQIGGAGAFLPAAWASAGIVNSGKTTSIPWFVDARAVYYRTDVFNRLGLTKKDIDTWAGFEATLAKIKKANLVINGVPIAPLGVPGKNDWNVLHNLAPWIWSSGGDMLTPDLKRAAFTDKKSIAGVNYFVGLAQKGYIPRSCLELNTAQVAAKFNEGQYAIYFDTPAQIKNLSLPYEKGGASGSIAAQNYNVALYPKGPAGRYTFFGGSNLAIFKSSKNKDKAWRVVTYLVSKDVQIKYSKLTGFIPSRKDGFADPYFTRDSKRKLFIEAIKYGKTYPCISAWGPMEPILMRHIGIIWDHVAGVYGKFTPSVIDKAFSQAAKEVNILLSESYK